MVSFTTAFVSGYSTLPDSNPFRYRGYYYDTETGFYYLSSRYYDPVTGRFISMDDVSVVTASPTALQGKNLFAYCDNNPVMRVDNGGAFWEIFLPFIPWIDGPLPVADVIAVGLALLTVAATQTATQDISLPKWETKEIELKKEKEVDVTLGRRPINDVRFPENPDDFRPCGLIRNDYAGTHNGRIIKWKDMYGQVIFEWNEDLNYRSHYHILVRDVDPMHYFPNYPVPEPFAHIYFPFGMTK